MKAGAIPCVVFGIRCSDRFAYCNAINKAGLVKLEEKISFISPVLSINNNLY
jgi:hypothetical protein